MAALGSAKEDWIPSEGETQYVVLDEGKILGTAAPGDYRFTKLDMMTITADGKASVKLQSLNTTLTGGTILSLGGVVKILFQDANHPVTYTFGLGSPLIKKNMVAGATSVTLTIGGGGSGSNEIQSGVTIARLV